ncbi:hypothetical protein CH063_04515 [Colletotrichum higginsianum]|uniref:Uncharacterized protein n=1 Tax=Colletotrichum higginsianum (strain IMI 349063) TaxID=759273 RepID=H1UVQ6_COLHI|nr:hypothetical protein CH063_04515 [Colletotrichum higginsianum]
MFATWWSRTSEPLGRSPESADLVVRYRRRGSLDLSFSFSFRIHGSRPVFTKAIRIDCPCTLSNSTLFPHSWLVLWLGWKKSGDMVAKICIQFNAGVDISRTLCSLLPSLSRVSLAPSALGWNRRESGQAQPHVRNNCRSDVRVSVPHVDAPCLAWPFTFLGFCHRRRRRLPLFCFTNLLMPHSPPRGE